MHKFFDVRCSFDKVDTEQDGDLKFLPLFYTEIYEEIGKKQHNQYVYDCSYIGTAHPQKYMYINKMSQELKTVLPNQLIYHYMPSKLKYLLSNLLHIICLPFKVGILAIVKPLCA